MGKIIAFSGSHGTGKTTAAHAMAVKMKIAHPGSRVGFLAEVAPGCPYPINQETTAAGQLWIFAKQMERELWLSRENDFVVSDRCLLDVIAYTVVADLEDLADNMLRLFGDYVAANQPYQEVRILPPKPSYLVADGVRDTDARFQADVHDALLGLYRRCGDIGRIIHYIDEGV